MERVDDAIRPHIRIELSQRDQEALLRALAEPPQPTQEMVEAYRRYMKEIESR